MTFTNTTDRFHKFNSTTRYGFGYVIVKVVSDPYWKRFYYVYKAGTVEQVLDNPIKDEAVFDDMKSAEDWCINQWMDSDRTSKIEDVEFIGDWEVVYDASVDKTF